MDDWLPHRPTLRPGLRVTRRDDAHLQIGLHPGLRVVLPDRPAVRQMLADLEVGRRPALDDLEVRRCAHALATRNLLVDAGDVARHLTSGLPRPSVLAAYATNGLDAPARLDARRAARVGVVADEATRVAALRLLGSVGLGVAVPRDTAAACLVVTAGGEPVREDVDGLVRTGAPHLVARNVGARITLGPFVAPGLTACLRCVDAHLSDADPGHGLVAEQHPDRSEEPCDPALMSLALAWAVRDLVAYVEGGEPSTWSATVDLGSDPAPVRRSWTRHPRCGCSWGDYQYSESSLPSIARTLAREHSSQ